MHNWTIINYTALLGLLAPQSLGLIRDWNQHPLSGQICYGHGKGGGGMVCAQASFFDVIIMATKEKLQCRLCQENTGFYLHHLIPGEEWPSYISHYTNTIRHSRTLQGFPPS